MTVTGSFSSTNTFSESRARHVLEKIHADFLGLQSRAFSKLSSESIWYCFEVFSHLMLEKALKTVELQLHPPGRLPSSIIYTVISDGSIYSDDNSGGNNFWVFPDDTVVKFVFSWDQENSRAAEYIKGLGLGFGSFIEGDEIAHGQYSKSGFGVNIKRKGNWK